MSVVTQPRAQARPRPPLTPARDKAALVLRGLTAASVFLSAVVHLDLWAQLVKDVPTIGPLFLLNAAGGLAIGIAVLVWRHWLPLLAAIGFGLATLGAFWISVVWGLFGVHETATGAPQVLSQVAEIAAVVCAAAAWAVERWRTSS